ncbi:MAG TPA: TetR/AcrR family transcriptional regulator [Terriglobales bacterium]|nr:TetR/AcrR family transcriptional regulator [Terriglobales bacterium]
MSERSQPDCPIAAPVAAHRRQPVQDRSLRTVARILDATSSLLAHMALEEITTNQIAAAAGVSIGALYRFFPDKQTIIDAIAVRHVGQFRELVEAKILRPLLGEMEDLANFNPDAILNNMIDAYVAYLEAHPDFRAISFGRHISAATKRREASPRTGLPVLLKNFMLERLGIPNTPELDRRLSVVSEAGERLIAYAFEQPTRAERDLILGETKKMLAGYLFSAGQD